MKTNKQLKLIKYLYLLLCITIGLFIYETYSYVLDSLSMISSILLNEIHFRYPHLAYLKFDFSKENLIYPSALIIALIVLILLLLITYIAILYTFKKNNQRILYIVDEIKNDHFTPSSLDGELGLLEEKIYAYKKENEILKENVEKEKEVLNAYIENIMHQIKTPITAIRLNEEMLSMLQPHELLDKNEKSFQHLDYLLNDLLTLSRLENGHVHFQLMKKSLQELIDKVQEEIQPLVKQTNIKYRIKDIDFYYDEQWLKEAVCNIIKNALEENVTEIVVKSECDSSFLHLIIRDNGKGIPEKDLDHLFERFYRSPHNKKKGNGIGLSLTKEIIEKHHGTIHAYNDNGAVFEISFPLLDIKEKVSADEGN